MIYQFGPFELDMARVELRHGDKACCLEPQVFALLALLVENCERLVSKEEIIDKVWDGRVVSDAAVASRVKSARQALGDSDKTQRFIRTIHGEGYRFVSDAKALRGTTEVSANRIEESSAANAQPDKPARPSLAVLPFRLIGDGGRYAALAVALPDELITELSQLRWLFITARTSSFRLRASDTEFRENGALLRGGYCLLGTVEVSDASVVVAMQLLNTPEKGIVWADRFSGRIEDIHAMREDIRSRVLTALEI